MTTPTNSTTASYQAPPFSLALDQHSWDEYPHAVYDDVPVGSIQLADVIASALQVQGIALAEHRGKPAYRIDVDNVLHGGSGRLILTTDQHLCDVKRYHDLRDAVREPTTSSVTVAVRKLGLTAGQADRLAKAYVPGPTDAFSTPYVLVAREWTEGEGDPTAYENDEQRLFAFVCATVEAYTRLLVDDDVRQHPEQSVDISRELRNTINSIAENLTEGWELRSTQATGRRH